MSNGSTSVVANENKRCLLQLLRGQCKGMKPHKSLLFCEARFRSDCMYV